jgi:pimeloyl-ACP methyl ester carboxylesterase
MASNAAGSSVFPFGSVFTVDARQEIQGAPAPQVDQVDKEANDQSFDLAVIKFKDDGCCRDPSEIDAAAKCIQQARCSRLNKNGAVVVVFIHGWHHNASWFQDGTGDSHFKGFRQVLASLALREAERTGVLEAESGAQPLLGRRVVGVYLGWSGDPECSWLPRWLTHASFWERYKVAETIGGGHDMSKAIRKIVASTKDPLGSVPERPESPLILIGHSMGALMLESTFLSLLRAKDEPLVRGVKSPSVVEIRSGDTLISFPDVLIAINSAADSRIAKGIKSALMQRGLKKTLVSHQISYAPPLLVSLTSVADLATKVLWEAAHLWRRRTDGHDKSLLSHKFEFEKCGVPCVAWKALKAVDYGQNWHCLHPPSKMNGEATPSFAIDLPTRQRQGEKDLDVPHDRFRLAPLGNSQDANLAWVFQVPKEVIRNHNDIFNSQSSLLTMALIQISGAVMSLAVDWERNFETETP